MDSADFLIVGGGVAGLSLAARLGSHGRVVVLEGEQALGYHSSGRSVTFSHYGIGNATVRALTRWSRAFFLDPPDGFSPLCHRMPALFVATAEMLDTLATLEATTRGLSPGVERLDAEGMRALCPVLRLGDDAIVAGFADHDGLKLDADALLQGYARAARAGGGRVETDAAIEAIAHDGGAWVVTARNGRRWAAPVLVDAAGAWADGVAALAGVVPLGVTPLRRTIIVVDAPDGADTRGWPFVKSAVDDFYLMPESGRLLASPVDETPSAPCDAQPEEYDIAVAADRLAHFTTIVPRRIGHSWAGLRSFTRDRVPAAGFAPDAPGFFWLAGQGGYGLQTAPAMAEIAAALITGTPLPAMPGVDPAAVTVERLYGR
ncbi:NAD(P)/FAD-dependent oxidoreductase [Sphingomonas flavalba]|uniref:NAD(P)/FAD-dependent oxidoreductase n=1 Tax=Sphingomonas flavalba TaxID=2559804 RepID=UPI00109DB57B|nr:FAD-binding oxidoreductase [Sphingomonas flavalba]